MSDELLIEFSGHTCVLTLNRPEKMNAFNWSLTNKLVKAMKDVRFNPNIRTVVITGAGAKAFSAGADLKERAGMTELEVKEFLFTLRNFFTDTENLPVPVIAAVNGFALGGGTELALACDMIIASDKASFGLTETKLGIIPGAGGTQRMVRLIGKGKTKELIYTGRRFSAEEAMTLGMVSRVVEADKLMATTLELAETINKNGPIAVKQAKFAINQGSEVDLQTGLNIEAKASEMCIHTKDRLEGLRAFREKRAPQFKGE